jgi:hypothetical protein
VKFASLCSVSAVVVGTLALAAPAQSGIVTFVGQDDGAAIGSVYTNSDAALSSFLTAASGFGHTVTHGFGNQTLGHSSGTWLNGDGNWTTSMSGACCVNGFSGISNITGGNLNGFSVVGANSGKWLGFPDGSATFNNSWPTHSFGFFATGVQSQFGSAFTVNFNDGSPETLNVPVNVNGGVEYFGFTDTLHFSNITISRPGNDAWGVDGISFNSPNPHIPIILHNGSFQYDFSIASGATAYLDPALAHGYEFRIGSGDPNFASVSLPAIQLVYGLSFLQNGRVIDETLAANTPFFFPTGGVSEFRVFGINPGLDPSNTSAFITAVTFDGTGHFTGTQTPITAVPELSTWAMMLLGFGVFGLASYIRKDRSGRPHQFAGKEFKHPQNETGAFPSDAGGDPNSRFA